MKKATAKHLSSMSGKYSWAETTEAEHEAGKGLMASNNPAERGHGLTTRKLQVPLPFV